MGNTKSRIPQQFLLAVVADTDYPLPLDIEQSRLSAMLTATHDGVGQPNSLIAKRRGSIVRNLCREQRLEGRALNFSKPTFLLGTAEAFSKPVQLGSLSYVLQSIVGQIVCADRNDHCVCGEYAHSRRRGGFRSAESSPPSPPRRCSAEDHVPNRRVFVRYTTDEWKTYADAEATFTSQYWPFGSCYSFKVDTALESKGAHTLHFAICAQVLEKAAGQDSHQLQSALSRPFSPPSLRGSSTPVVREEHWDDNFGQNYSISMSPVSPKCAHVPL